MVGEMLTLAKGLVLWTGAHYGAVYGYQWFCVPSTWWGAAVAPIAMAAPHCRGLVWLIDITSLSVVGSWTAAGLLLSGKIVEIAPALVASMRPAVGGG